MMKYLALIALSGLAQLQQASAACCRTNKCLQAIAAAGDLGLAECAAKLTVTVTPSASIVQVTIPVVESAVATSLSFETTTDIAFTETVVFTEFSTVTASTETSIVSSTTTVPITETHTETITTVLSATRFLYVSIPPQKLKARQTSTPQAGQVEGKVPDYAFDACGGEFQKYAKACGCAGVNVVTVTASAEVETVTVIASTLTSVVSTYHSTQTETDLVTTTTLSTVTDIIPVTDTVTSTNIVTASSTTIVTEKSTAASVPTVLCKTKGTDKHYIFRALKSDDGSTRYMTSPNNDPSWQSTSSPATLPASSIWVVNADGYLENTLSYVAYIETATAGQTVRVLSKSRSEVDVGVAAGTFTRISACVNSATNALALAALGRNNIFTCRNSLYLSSGDGTDLLANNGCVRLFPTANDR